MDSVLDWHLRREQLRSSASSTRAWAREELANYFEHIDQTMSRVTSLTAKLFGGLGASQSQGTEKAVASLSAWSVGRLLNATELALDGYLVDAIILARSAFEGLLLLIAFDIGDETGSTSLLSTKWADGEFVGQKEVRTFFASHVNPQMASLSGLYRGVSNLSHPGHMRAVLLQTNYARSAGENVIQFRLEGVRKRNDLRIVIHFIWYQFLVLLGYLPLAFPSLEDGPQVQAFVSENLILCDELLAAVPPTG